MSIDTGRWDETSSNNKKTSIVVLGDLDITAGSTSGSRRSNKGHHHHTACSQRERKLSVLVILLSILCFGLVAYLFVSGPLSSLLIPVSFFCSLSLSHIQFTLNLTFGYKSQKQCPL